jgi:hypothetical protein
VAVREAQALSADGATDDLLARDAGAGIFEVRHDWLKVALAHDAGASFFEVPAR